MNKDLNLVEILKDVPLGTKLYSSIFGDVTLALIDPSSPCPIRVVIKDRDGDRSQVFFTSHGSYFPRFPDSECALFPSKDQRDWSKFTYEYKPKDKELVWAWDDVSVCSRILCFYSAEKQRPYLGNGSTRGHLSFDNYAPYEGEYPEWAKEAQKTLED